MLRDMDIVVWSLDDLRPAVILVKHGFELTDGNPIYSRSCRLLPRHNDLVRNEIDKMLTDEFITPSHSARSFSIFTAGKNEV